MKIISCSDAVATMFEVLDGMVTDLQRKELDVHIEQCRHCCDRFEFEKLFKEKLGTIAAQEKAPKELVKKVERLLKEF